MLKIERKADARAVKALLHRIADIPGGVTIKTSVLGGTALLEGTPIGPITGGNGLYGVTKTAKVVTEAADDATAYEVAKGHHFKVGDFFGTTDLAGKAITAIDKTTSAVKDTITLAATLGAVVAVDTVAIQTAEGGKVALVAPTAVAGTSHDVVASDNLFVDGWLIGVVKEANAPAVNDAIKTALKGVSYL